METEFVQTEGAENETEKAPSKEKTSDEEDEGKGFRFEFRLSDWLTGNLESVMLIVQLVLAAGVILCVTIRLVKQRRIRLGRKNDPDGRIRALYHSVYRLLVDSGMDESCTAVMTGGAECAAENPGDAMADYMQEVCPEIHVDEIRRMEALVLRTYYGFGGRTEQEAAWMLDFYGKVRRGLWRKLGVRKLLRYFIS